MTSSATSTGARPRRRDIFTDFHAGDWVFVLFLYMLVVYGALQVGLFVFLPGWLPFDYMPLVNGGVFIFVAWDAIRLKRRMREILAGLHQSGGVRFASPQDYQRIVDKVMRLSRVFGLGATLVVGFGMLGGLVYYLELLDGATIDIADGVVRGAPGWRIPLPDVALFVATDIFAALVGGWFLGGMLANGRLLEVLDGSGYRLSGFASETGIKTLRKIEAIFACAARATLALCACFATWWVVYRAGLLRHQYHDWIVMFLILWGLAFIGFVFTVLIPVRAFNKRLDQVYGGRDARRLMNEQVALARGDLAALDKTMRSAREDAERQRLTRQRDDLLRFIGGLKNRMFRGLYLRPAVLTACALANLAALLVPLALSAVSATSTSPAKADEAYTDGGLR